MNARHAAVASLALGLMIALAANLTYAIPRGPVATGLGLVAPLVLPVVLHLRTTFTPSNIWHRGLRELATAAVAGPAAAVSYVHTYELILGAGEPWILAVLAPLSSDGLAGMATLALYLIQRGTPAANAGQQHASPGSVQDLVDEQALAKRPAVLNKAETTPKPTPARPPQQRPRTGRRPVAASKAARIAWAKAEWPVTGNAIALRFNCSRAEGDRIRALAKAEMAKGQAS